MWASTLCSGRNISKGLFSFWGFLNEKKFKKSQLDIKLELGKRYILVGQ